MYKKEILEFNRHALQFLHRAAGFDFEKPHTIHRINGRFTFNQVRKLIPDGCTAALLIRLHDKDLRWANTDRFYYVTLTDTGFDADRHDFVDYWDFRDTQHPIDWVIGKGNFEEKRKKAALYTYVFTQNKEYMMLPAREMPRLDGVRYDFRIHYNDLYIKRRGHNEKEIVYNRNDFGYYRKTLPVWECIDKSGYLINRRRADLIRRAAALKAEREKAAADASNYLPELEEIVKEFEAARAELAKAIERATCFDDFSDYAHRCYDLGHAGSDIRRTRELLENKSFRSIAAIEKALQGIRDRINREV